MIDPLQPDFADTPAHSKRPPFHYQPQNTSTPELSIVTPYYNTGALFADTVCAIQRMSFTNWEWLIVDDGSTDHASLAQLDKLQASEPRVRVIHQAQRGPGAARNRAFAEARAEYVMQLDSDDLVEPTFAEKCLWFLATQPQFAACNSWNVGFGAQNYLWRHGFEEGAQCLTENQITNIAVIRRSAHSEVGGYDESVSFEHADWDYWLNLAEMGYWGYTIPEFLSWYRRQQKSLVVEIAKDKRRSQRFYYWLRAKHIGLEDRFPKLMRERSVNQPFASVNSSIPFRNSLAKEEEVVRVLLVIPWMRVGGADRFNLDIVRLLSAQGYEFTIVTTVPSDNLWLSEFTRWTPDIFCLDNFLNSGDYPRFLSYLIESRGIRTILLSNSELGYLLLPYLRVRHPEVAILDFCHMQEETWKNGGYAGMAVRADTLIDQHLTASNSLSSWMTEHGADSDRVSTCYIGVDSAIWKHGRRLGKPTQINTSTRNLIFIGRMSAQKRPHLVIEIVRRLRLEGFKITCLMVGDGEELPRLKTAAEGLPIMFTGAVPPDDIRELLALSNILVLPSAFEGLALVLFEAMAMEVVPVAADVGGHAELVAPECGILIPQTDDEDDEVDAYVRALKTLLTDPLRRADMAKQCRERVTTYFSQEKMIGTMDQLLKTTKPRNVRQDDLARYSTEIAIEMTRVATVADELWLEREKYQAGQAELAALKAHLDSLHHTHAIRLVQRWWRFKAWILEITRRAKPSETE